MRGKLSAGVAGLALALGPTLASSADLPPAPPPGPVYVPAPFSFSGFYIGANVGGAWASSSLTDNLTGVSLSGHLRGWIGGGQFGFNYENGPLLVGIEAMFDGSSLRSTTTTVAVPPFGVLQASANADWISTAAARFGILADNAQHWLVYGKAGAGWVGNRASITNLTTGVSASTSNTNDGWLLGGGIEVAFAHNWTVKLEYDYLALQHFTAASPILGDTVDVRRQLNLIMVGLNYKFDWGPPVPGPVVAKY